MRNLKREERGSITPFVVIVALGIILLAGLVIDGGRQLNAKGRAIAYAQEAARAGSQGVDIGDPRLDLDPALALAAARVYCQQAMSQDPQLARCVPSMTTVNDAAGTFRAVRVEAQVRIRAILLGIIDRHTLTAGGLALARPVSGISEADTGKVSDMAPPQVNDAQEEQPGHLDNGGITLAPCVPIPPSPTAQPTPTPTPADKPNDKPGDKPDPKPSESASPSPWPPELPPGQEYCPPAEEPTPLP